MSGVVVMEARDNYNKVVLDRRLCVSLWDDRPKEGSPDLVAWGARQEAERERIRKLDHTPLVSKYHW